MESQVNFQNHIIGLLLSSETIDGRLCAGLTIYISDALIDVIVLVDEIQDEKYNMYTCVIMIENVP